MNASIDQKMDNFHSNLANQPIHIPKQELLLMEKRKQS